jgi:VWFA-related protein
MTTLKVSSRMVTLEVSARDGKGHAVTGLTADDFQIFEQIPPKKDQRPQRIAAFQKVSIATIAAADKGGMQMPAGVYSNLVTMQKVAVPPTILLLDGLNTNLAASIQVHRQMVKLLASIPQEIPVAVFLLDRNLHLLQNFSTDRTLLRTAVDRALSIGAQELNPTDVRADPDSLAELVQDNPPPPPQPPPGAAQVSTELQQNRNSAISDQVAQLQHFEREASTTLVTIRVQITIDAFRSIARHVAGYPGRKNLLWVASSFPLAIFPDSDFKFAGQAEFQDKFALLAGTLSDAKIAVYPMDPSGLEAQGFYDASSRPSARSASVGTQTSAALMRDEGARDSNQETMRQLATETGGQVCVNNNDLADCVKKAVDDGSSYYELAYYPDNGNWNGEFHRVIVKARQAGVHLSFREGYYARATPPPGGDDTKRLQTELQEAACRDLLTSTNILVMAQSIAPDDPTQVKYFIAMDPNRISFVPTTEGRKLSITVAACSLNKDGAPIQFLQQPTDATLTEQQYSAVMAQHGFTRTLGFPAAAGTARIRLLVRDNANGKMGSVDMPYQNAPAADTAHRGCVGPGPCDTTAPQVK